MKKVTQIPRTGNTPSSFHFCRCTCSATIGSKQTADSTSTSVNWQLCDLIKWCAHKKDESINGIVGFSLNDPKPMRKSVVIYIRKCIH